MADSDQSSGWGSRFHTSSSNPSGANDILDALHPDLLSLLTFAQYHRIHFLPLSWDGILVALGKGATGDVRQSSVNLNLHLAFKRFKRHFFSNEEFPNRSEQAAGVRTMAFSNTDGLFQYLVRELVLLNQPDIQVHPYIVNIEGICFDVETGHQNTFEVWPVLVFNKAQHGSIKDYMSSATGLRTNWDERLKLCAQIGSAISIMHINNIVHGDIKPENILVYEDQEGQISAKMTDFSYSCFGKEEHDLVRLPATKGWTAPEYHGRQFTIQMAKKTDIYSFGMVCLWLLFPEAFGELRKVESTQTQADPGFWQDSAMKLALENEVEQHDGQSLKSFFKLALAVNPNEREGDLKQLIHYLGQVLWEAAASQMPFDGRRRLALADYGATTDDIKDPKKLQVLQRKILNSLSLTGDEYHIMREQLDASKFGEDKRPKFIESVLEGLSKFGVSSAEKDDQMKEALAHNCLNIVPSFFQLSTLDYRVRIQITKCLQDRATGSCEKCFRSASSELALCYTVGFGVHSDEMEAKTWLDKSRTPEEEFQERLAHLKHLSPGDIEFGKFWNFAAQGGFLVQPIARYGNTNLASTEDYLTREVQDLEEVLGCGHWLTFEIQITLLHVLNIQRKHGEAQDVSQSLEVSTKEKYGDESALHVRAMQELARSLWKQEHWDEAERLLNQAKIIHKKNVGSEHLLTLGVSLDLARVYGEHGKNSEAEREWQELTKSLEKNVPPSHPFARLANQEHANLLQGQGRVEEAILLREQHATRNQIIDKLNLEHNEGWGAMQRGQLGKAETMLSQVIQKIENLCQNDQDMRDNLELALLSATRNLALVYRNQGRLIEAENLQRDVTEKTKAILGLSNEATLDICWDLARTYQMQEKWVEAEKMLLEVKVARESLLGPAHKKTVQCSRRLAEVYRGQKEEDKEEKEMEFTKKACIKRLGLHHKDTFNAVRDLAIAYLSHNKLEQADAEWKTTVLLSHHLLGPHHAETLGALSNRGLVFLQIGRLEDAQQLLVQTRKEMLEYLGPKHQYTIITTHHLRSVFIQQSNWQGIADLEQNQPVIPQQLAFRPLSEDEQIQLAIAMSIQEQQGPPTTANDKGDEDDDDDDDDMENLRMAIEMSLQTEEENTSVDLSSEPERGMIP